MMVNDTQLRTEFRLCPDAGEGTDGRPLVQQHITQPTCHARQGRGYHKCHRCVYQEIERVNLGLVKLPMS